MILSIAFLYGGNYNYVEAPGFVPTNYFVGDHVQCRILIDVSEGTELVVPDEDNLPDRVDIIIQDVQVYPYSLNRYEVIIHFMPFYPQQQLMPPIDLGDVVLTDITVNTFSVLQDQQTALANLRAQYYLPYTREIVLIFVFLLLVFPIGYLTFSDKFRRRLLSRLSSKTRVKPYNQINSLIRDLGENAGVVSPREFYIRLTKALRLYLSELTGNDYISITTGEITSRLKIFFQDKRIVESVFDIMQFADEIKFSGKRAARAHQRRDLVRLKRCVSLIEKEMVIIRQESEAEATRVRKTTKSLSGRISEKVRKGGGQ